MIPQFEPHWGDDETKAVMEVLESDYLNEGDCVRRFEEEFASFVGAKYCVATTSGTASLYMSALAAYGDDAEDAITVPSHEGIFAFNAILGAGSEPRVVASMPDVVVHANGRVSDNANLMEDCSQAIQHHAKGCISAYSFASTKHITTGGQGGAVCCDLEEEFEDLVKLKDQGRLDRYRGGGVRQEYDYWGMNFKMTEMQAAFGLAQLRKLPSRIERFVEIYSIYAEYLRGVLDFSDTSPRWYADAFHDDADKLVHGMNKAGIGCRKYPKPLHQQGVAYGRVEEASFGKVEDMCRRGFYLPSSTNLLDSEVEQICETLLRVEASLN